MVSFPGMLTSAILLLVAAVPGFAVQECEEDHECYDQQFCYESRRCASCIVCAAYNRHPGLQSCAKAWQDCGGCLKGFLSEAIPGAMQRGNCLPRVDSPAPTVGGSVNNGTSSMPHTVQVIVVAMGMALVVSGGVYLAFKGRQRMRRQQPDIECGRGEAADGDIPLMRRSHANLPDQDRPPPGPERDRDPPPPAYGQLKPAASFAHAQPSAPPAYCEGAEPCAVVSVDFRFTETCEGKQQQATPFTVADNVTYRMNEAEPGEVEEVEVVEEEVEVESQGASGRSTPVNLHEDESTMPSPWVPSNAELHGGGSLDDDSGVCNFSVSPSSSTASLHDTAAPPLSFSGLFAQGGAVPQTVMFAQGQPQTGLAAQAALHDSSEADVGERPAKRLRADSGSVSDE